MVDGLYMLTSFVQQAVMEEVTQRSNLEKSNKLKYNKGAYNWQELCRDSASIELKFIKALLLYIKN